MDTKEYISSHYAKLRGGKKIIDTNQTVA